MRKDYYTAHAANLGSLRLLWGKSHQTRYPTSGKM